MHAAFGHSQQSGPRMPIRGTFYPTEARSGSIGSVLPKVLAVVVTMAVVRTLIASAKRHGGSSRWSRRREAIAELHRELHAQEAAGESA